MQSQSTQNDWLVNLQNNFIKNVHTCITEKKISLAIRILIYFNTVYAISNMMVTYNKMAQKFWTKLTLNEMD